MSVRARERPTRPRLNIGRSVTVVHSNVDHVVVTERVVPVYNTNFMKFVLSRDGPYDTTRSRLS